MSKAMTEDDIKKLLEERQRLKTKYFPTYKLLKKRKLKFKHARVEDIPVEYCRIDEMQKIVNDHHDQFREVMGTEKPLETLKKILYYFSRPLNAPPLRYPQVLVQSKTPTQFASFPFNTEQSRKGLMIAIILGILAIVLFPVWPFELKYAVFIISFYILMTIIGIVVVRLALYSIFSLFGFSFWVFPRMLIDNSFITCWKPFYSFEKWETNTFNIILRIAILSVFVYYGYSFYTDPSLFQENIKITKTAIDDLHEWGLKKIKRQQNFSQRALTSLEDIMNKTKDSQQNKTNITTQSEKPTEASETPTKTAAQTTTQQQNARFPSADVLTESGNTEAEPTQQTTSNETLEIGL